MNGGCSEGNTSGDFKMTGSKTPGGSDEEFNFKIN